MTYFLVFVCLVLVWGGVVCLPAHPYCYYYFFFLLFSFIIIIDSSSSTIITVVLIHYHKNNGYFSEPLYRGSIQPLHSSYLSMYQGVVVIGKQSGACSPLSGCLHTHLYFLGGGILFLLLSLLWARANSGVCGGDVARRVSLIYFPAELSRAAGNTEEDRTLERNIYSSYEVLLDHKKCYFID